MKYRLAFIYQRNSRVAQGERCMSALAKFSNIQIDQYDLKEIQAVSGGYDYYIRFDDGDYLATIPSRLRPAAWWISDTHLKHPYRQIRKQVGLYDEVFLAQKDAVKQVYQDTGKNTHWLPWAADDRGDEFGFLPDDQRLWDVSFIGTSGKFSLRKVVLETLQQYYPKSYVGRAEYTRLHEYYAKSKIVVNYPIRHDVNMRFFEAMAAGAMVLSSRVEGNGISELFRENETIVYYDDCTDGLRRKLDYYLQHESERMAIAKRGFDLVNSRHTYHNRVRELFRTLNIELNDGR
jgi:spore maturation protein CgeB